MAPPIPSIPDTNEPIKPIKKSAFVLEAKVKAHHFRSRDQTETRAACCESLRFRTKNIWRECLDTNKKIYTSLYINKKHCYEHFLLVTALY